MNGHFETLTEKVKHSRNETTLSLTCYKLVRQCNEMAEEWIGDLRVKATECKYKEIEYKKKWQAHTYSNYKINLS